VGSLCPYPISSPWFHSANSWDFQQPCLNLTFLPWKSVAASFSPLAPAPMCFTWRMSCTQAQQDVSSLPKPKPEAGMVQLKGNTFLCCIWSPCYLLWCPLPIMDILIWVEIMVFCWAQISRPTKTFPAWSLFANSHFLHTLSHSWIHELPQFIEGRKETKFMKCATLKSQICTNLSVSG